jgi:spermidine/putrescine transport system substrate-binding protein
MAGNVGRFRASLAGLAISFSALLSTAALPAPVHAQEIHVLNWKGWGTDDAGALAEFKQRTGIKVVHDYITSYPEVFTKLHTNPGYYDVVILNAAFVGQAVRENLLAPIDPAALKNYSLLFPELRDSPQLSVDGKLYGVAWAWGVTSVVYDTNVFKEAPTSLAVLWDPKYAGRVCWRDDPEDSVRFAALALGQNPDQPQDLNAVTEKLRALKPQIKAFWKSEDEWRKLVAAKECDLSIFWTSSANRAIERKTPVSYFVPKEGAIAFRDSLVIPAGTKNRAHADAFVDFLISKDFYQYWVKTGGAPVSTNSTAVADLPETSMTRTVLTQPENMKRTNFKGPLTDEQRQTYLSLWQKTKAYYAQ